MTFNFTPNAKASAETRKFVSLLLAFCFSISLSASRRIISLNNGWSFSRPSDTTYVNVNLPHCFSTDAYITRDYYRGAGEYNKKLVIPTELSGKKIYLKLDGAATKSTVSIDGEPVSTHIGAYSPHLADITPFLKPQHIQDLSIVVDNSDKDIPPYSADFTFMGGLYRDAWLIAMPPVHMDIVNGPDCGFKVTTVQNNNGDWDLNVSSSIINTTTSKNKLTLQCLLIDSENNIIGSVNRQINSRPESTTDCELTIKGIKNIRLWSPEHPNLYTVRLTVSDDSGEIDTAETYTAFRTFGFDSDNRFLLNGKPYKLRGMCRHQDQFPMGIALSDDQHRRDMKLIKDAGTNFIRISHYPQDDAILEMCDRLGLIVWEEIPVIDFVPESPAFDDNCESMLRDMIRSHYNHPSIAMWGYMNEILLRAPGENREKTFDRTLQLADRLERALREEDPNRLSTMAFHGSDIYHDAALTDITDIKGWNLYQGWYGGKLNDFEAFLSRQHHEHPDHRIIVSEYGAGSDLRLHSLSPQPFDFSIEYQQDYLEHYLPVIEDSAFVAGASHWNFIDFSSANRAESMPHINNKGIVTNDRRKKDVYYLFAASWKDLSADTVAHIATRDWSQRTELIDDRGVVTRPIKVYTNLPEVSLRVNGHLYHAEPVRNHTAVFNVDLHPGKNNIELLDGNTLLDVTQIALNGLKISDGKIMLGDETLTINVGSNAYFRSSDDGLTWLPDKLYTPGSVYGHIGGKMKSTQDEIALTGDDPLLQSCITGIDSYKVDVSDGKYEIELLFADLSSPAVASAYLLGRDDSQSTEGICDMQIFINGRRVESSFVPATESGVKTMVKKRYFAEADKGAGLSVSFIPNNNHTTSLSAIKIIKK